MSAVIQSSGQTGYAIPNAQLSVADDGSNNLIISVLTATGTDPSPTNPLYIAFNDAVQATLYTRIITYPLSLTIPAGATLGTFDAVASRFWIGAFDVGGTVYLGLCNCNTGTEILTLTSLIGSASAISAASDTAGEFYATSSIAAGTSFRLVGHITYAVPLPVAGNWSGLSLTYVEMIGPNRLQPGDVVQTRRWSSGAVATGTTLIPFDDTIPVLGEGDIYLQQSIVPQSAANLLRHRVNFDVTHSLAAQPCIIYLSTLAGATMAVGWNTSPAANAPFSLQVQCVSRPLSIPSSTYCIVAGGTTGGTLTLNGVGGARKLGTFLDTSYTIEEIRG